VIKPVGIMHNLRYALGSTSVWFVAVIANEAYRQTLNLINVHVSIAIATVSICFILKGRKVES